MSVGKDTMEGKLLQDPPTVILDYLHLGRYDLYSSQNKDGDGQ